MGGFPAGFGRVALAEAVVLHRRAYRETSLLVEAFSADHGRVRLLAKGAQRGRAPLARWLQPFIPLRLSWSGRGELPVVTGAEPGEEAIPLTGQDLFCGFYLNELLLKLLPVHDPHPGVFRLYLAALRQLGAGKGRERTLRDFEVALLDEIGYGLALDREAVSGDAIDPAKRYVYVIDQGPVATDQAGEDTVSGATLIALRQRRFAEAGELAEAKRLLRRVIHAHLNGRTLKSRDLFKPVERKELP